MFAHYTQILSEDTWPQVPVGTEVEFTPGHNDRGKPAALNITLVGGGPINSMDPSVSSRVLSDFTVIGEVAYFKKDIGHGAIVCEIDLPWPQVVSSGSFIFVSREDLVILEGSACSLIPGMTVEFKVFQSEKGVQAAEVTDVGGGPLFIEPGKGKGKGKGKDKASKGTGKGITNFWVSAVKGKGSFGANKGKGSGVQKPIHKSYGGTVHSQINGSSMGKGFGVPASPTSFSGFPGTDPFMDEAFKYANPEEQVAQVAALSIMEEAMAQAAMAQAAMEQARALLHKTSPGDGQDGQAAALARFLSGTPSLSQMQESAESALQGTRKKTKVPCRFFADGRCSKGAACEFSHDLDMYKPVPLESKVAKPCTFYDQGKCTRGAACPFAHGPDELMYIEAVKGMGKGIHTVGLF